MAKDRLLLVLVAADVLLAFSSIGAEMFFSWTLPGALQKYLESRAWTPSTPWEYALCVLWAGSVGCTVAGWIGLINYWSFARRLYLVAWATWTLLILLSGPSVLTPVGAVVDTLGAVVAGAILGLVYFSDLSRRFEPGAGTVRVGARATA
jgi:hypothetical protein